MVRVKMRHDEAREAPAAQRAVKKPLPNGLGQFIADASVDDGPAVAIVNEVNIDVVEPERQRQPPPQHARVDLNQFIGF